MASMSIGDATVALVESRLGGMNFSAYPSRLAMVLAVIDNGALSLEPSCFGSDGHKAALEEVQRHVTKTLTTIAQRERRAVYIEKVREHWVEKAATRYTEREGIDPEKARENAVSLLSIVAAEIDDDDSLPDAAEAADEDMDTWS
jgi:hypothetical protein